MAMTIAGQVVGQSSSFLPDYSKGRLAAAYIFRMMSVVPLIDNYSTEGLQKVREKKKTKQKRNKM
jgi:hypothetical protein